MDSRVFNIGKSGSRLVGQVVNACTVAAASSALSQRDKSVPPAGMCPYLGGYLCRCRSFANILWGSEEFATSSIRS